jgi:hypothetical protein
MRADYIRWRILRGEAVTEDEARELLEKRIRWREDQERLEVARRAVSSQVAPHVMIASRGARRGKLYHGARTTPAR